MYNNPLMYSSMMGRSGLFSGIRNLNWAGFLDNTQRTLGIINQAIPIVNQVKPIFNNAKTMLRIANSLNTNDINTKPIEEKSNINNTNYTNKPIFYI